MTTFKVVLNRNIAYGATSSVVHSKDAALEVARHYWEVAEEGHKVQIYFPADSRDMADWQWIKGKDEGP